MTWTRSDRSIWTLLLTGTATLGLAAGQVGTNYCIPLPNSTGAAASISGSGSNWIPLDNLRLSSVNLPQNATAYFICSRLSGFVQGPGGSSGNLCLSAPIGRLVGGVVANSGATGRVSVLADLGAMPQVNGTVVVQAGETWHFQCWFRDAAASGGSTSNFSDGLQVLFTNSSGTGPIAGMMPIPAGTFIMGSDLPGSVNIPPYFNGSGNRPAHQVTISYPFWMGRHEVTQGEYTALMGSSPSNWPTSDRPVTRVTWNQARAYCLALTAREAANIPPGYEYRLPTEAEWEYACRAGTTTEFHYGQELFCSQAWCGGSYHSTPPLTPCDTSGNLGPISVGTFAPNAFGLYDMHGNVWELCLDSLRLYTPTAVVDPIGFTSTTLGDPAIRGGSYNFTSYHCRSAWRRDQWILVTADWTGFRVVLGPIVAF